MVDTRHLKCLAERHASSTLARGTIMGRYPVGVAVLTVNQLLDGSGGSTPSLPTRNMVHGIRRFWMLVCETRSLGSTPSVHPRYAVVMQLVDIFGGYYNLEFLMRSA